jgi:hypothetical protein
VLATVSFYLVAIAIFTLSKFMLSTIQRKRPFSYGNILLWVVAEASAISVIYTLFTELFVIPDPTLFLPILGRSFLVLLFILFIPYIISILFATTVHQRKLLNRLSLKVSTDKNPSNDPKLIPLVDSTGKLKMSISIDTLYYVESQDNYVKIYYDSDGKLCNYMLRSTTKAIETKFGDWLIRCHRGYLVNKNKIRIFRNDRDGMYIRLMHDGIRQIPVSKSYASNIQRILSHSSIDANE